MKVNHGFIQPLLLILLTTSVAVFTDLSARADNWDVDGEHGELYVYGALAQGACQLNMESRDQQVDLGSIATGALRKPGDSGMPVPFTLKFTRCVDSGGVQEDRYTGRLVWDPQQPVVTIQTAGTGGIALRIEDSLHRTVIPGERGVPQFLTPGSNVLAFTVTPVRTTSPLIAGKFSAAVNFQVNYD